MINRFDDPSQNEERPGLNIGFQNGSGELNNLEQRNEYLKKKDEEFQKQILIATERIDPESLSPHHIYLCVTGIIESGKFADKIQFVLRKRLGTHFSKSKFTKGQVSGLSQSSTATSLNNKNIVWNYPFEAIFRSTNPNGWPQLILTVYGLDFIGRSIIKGYGSIHLPTEPGYHERKVYLYRPLPMSIFSSIFGYMRGHIAEYQKPEKTIASGEGREVTRVEYAGSITVKFHVMQRNMRKFGYVS